MITVQCIQCVNVCSLNTYDWNSSICCHSRLFKRVLLVPLAATYVSLFVEQQTIGPATAAKLSKSATDQDRFLKLAGQGGAGKMTANHTIRVVE